MKSVSAQCPSHARALPVAALLLLALASAPASAFERGDQCTLKSPLPIQVKTKTGTIEATLEKGTDMTVTFAGEGGVTRIQAGETSGTVITVDLEAACAGTLRMCSLVQPITMFEKNRSDSRSFKVKAGAEVSMLKRGKVWAAIRVGDLVGFVDTQEIGRNCRLAIKEDVITYDDGVDEAPTGSVTSVERGEGPGVLLLPFSLEGNAPAGAADEMFQTLWERAAYFRPDAGRLEDEGIRKLPWKKYVDASVARAKQAEMRYALIGRVFIDDTAPKPGEVVKESYVLQLGVYEAKSGKQLKGVRVKPSTRLDDPWADNALAKLLPELAGAPGSRMPAGAAVPTQAPAQPQEEPAPAAPRTGSTYEGPAWFTNPYGYAALGVAVLAGGGGAALAWLALADNGAANDTPVTDEGRSSLRTSALYKGAAADALGAVAVVSVVTSAVVFISRAGLE